MRYLVRDFMSSRGGGFAVLHVGHCEQLRRIRMDEHGARHLDTTVLEHTLTASTVDGAAAQFQRKWSVEVPLRRCDCIGRHVEALTVLRTPPELADELRLSTDDLDDLVARVMDANPGLSVSADNKRGGRWLLKPEVTSYIREHVAKHPDEYPRLPAAPDTQPS